MNSSHNQGEWQYTLFGTISRMSFQHYLQMAFDCRVPNKDPAGIFVRNKQLYIRIGVGNSKLRLAYIFFPLNFHRKKVKANDVEVRALILLLLLLQLFTQRLSWYPKKRFG